MSVISTLLTITKSASNRTPYFQITHCLMPLKCLMFWQSRKGRNKENSQVNFDGKTILTKSTKSLLGCDKGCYFLVTTLLLNARWVIMYCIMYNLCHWRFFLWLCPPSDARADLEFLKSLFELVKKLMQQSSKKNNLLRTFADSSKCTSMPKIQFELCLSEISFDCKPFFKKSTSSVSSKFANKVYFAFVLLLGWLKM